MRLHFREENDTENSCAVCPGSNLNCRYEFIRLWTDTDICISSNFHLLICGNFTNIYYVETSLPGHIFYGNRICSPYLCSHIRIYALLYLNSKFWAPTDRFINKMSHKSGTSEVNASLMFVFYSSVYWRNCYHLSIVLLEIKRITTTTTTTTGATTTTTTTITTTTTTSNLIDIQIFFHAALNISWI